MTGRAVETPVHEGEVAGAAVRWFASPRWRREGTPDMPWHATADLWRALGLDGRAAEGFLRKLRAEWDEPYTVAVADGLVTVAPHFMAEGLVAALLDTADGPAAREVLTKARGDYRRNCTAALKEMLRGMHPLGKVAFALEAMEAGRTAG